MVCIYCGNSTQVANSRPQKRLNQVWRRRHCTNCGATFTTEESTNFGESWRVVTQKATLLPFNKYRLFVSLYTSLEHRPTAISDAAAITDTIISLLGKQTDRGRLETTQIVLISYAVLANFDTAAAVRYRAFHPFQD